MHLISLLLDNFLCLCYNKENMKKHVCLITLISYHENS
nr:MAG TPA: hypothetical protein [Caudoviricetes sp.]